MDLRTLALAATSGAVHSTTAQGDANAHTRVLRQRHVADEVHGIVEVEEHYLRWRLAQEAGDPPKQFSSTEAALHGHPGKLGAGALAVQRNGDAPIAALIVA
eukprot:12877300-Alexandrium_andersonii.AAC.1